jgi:Tfp pilus assembly PilM family ATPase
MTDTVSYFTREFYKGGDDLTDAVSKKLSLEAREAENLKRTVAAGAALGGGSSVNLPLVVVDPEDAERLKQETVRRDPTTSVPIVMLEQGDTRKFRGGSTSITRSPGGGVSADAERVAESLGGVLEDICHDINISIDYFENQYDKKVEEVFITGGASNTAGFQETLERTVQKPVNRWNPTQHLELDLPRDSAQELQDAPTQAAIALGLASRIRRD